MTSVTRWNNKSSINTLEVFKKVVTVVFLLKVMLFKKTNSSVQTDKNETREASFAGKAKVKRTPTAGTFPSNSVTRLGNLLHFGQLLKACGSNYFSQIRLIFGIFYKDVKIFNFSSGNIFGQLL